MSRPRIYYEIAHPDLSIEIRLCMCVYLVMNKQVSKPALTLLCGKRVRAWEHRGAKTESAKTNWSNSRQSIGREFLTRFDVISRVGILSTKLGYHGALMSNAADSLDKKAVLDAWGLQAP